MERSRREAGGSIWRLPGQRFRQATRLFVSAVEISSAIASVSRANPLTIKEAEHLSRTCTQLRGPLQECVGESAQSLQALILIHVALRVLDIPTTRLVASFEERSRCLCIDCSEQLNGERRCALALGMRATNSNYGNNLRASSVSPSVATVPCPKTADAGLGSVHAAQFVADSRDL